MGQPPPFLQHHFPTWDVAVCYGWALALVQVQLGQVPELKSMLNFVSPASFRSLHTLSFPISRFYSSVATSVFRNMPKADSPTGFKPLKDTALFSPLKLGSLNLEHRIVQAPLTRMRATKESDGVTVPNDLNAEYYAQRANKGGLQLTEATDICKYVSIRNPVA